LLQPLPQLRDAAGLELRGQDADGERVELHPVKQLDQRLAFGRGHGGRGRQLHQGGAPFQRVVGGLLAAQALQRHPPVDVRALGPVGGVAEVGPPGGAKHSRTARLGPRHRDVQQRPQRLRGEAFQIVQDDQRGRLSQHGGGGVGVEQGLVEDLADFVLRHGHGVVGLHAGVAHEDGGLEKSCAG